MKVDLFFPVVLTDTSLCQSLVCGLLTPARVTHRWEDVVAESMTRHL